MNSFRVIAVDVSGRPNEVPVQKWLVKDCVYTVVEVCRCNAQGGLFGFKLAEIDLSRCEPYQYFAANRFIPEPDGQDPMEKETYEDELVA